MQHCSSRLAIRARRGKAIGQSHFFFHSKHSLSDFRLKYHDVRGRPWRYILVQEKASQPEKPLPSILDDHGWRLVGKVPFSHETKEHLGQFDENIGDYVIKSIRRQKMKIIEESVPFRDVFEVLITAARAKDKDKPKEEITNKVRADLKKLVRWEEYEKSKTGGQTSAAHSHTFGSGSTRACSYAAQGSQSSVVTQGQQSEGLAHDHLHTDRSDLMDFDCSYDADKW